MRLDIGISQSDWTDVASRADAYYVFYFLENGGCSKNPESSERTQKQ